MMTKKEEIMQTTAQLVRKYDMSVDEIEKLISIERGLHNLDVYACNGKLTSVQEARLQRLEAQSQTILDTGGYAAIAYHQCDPRGGALVIVDKAELGDKNIRGYYTSYGIYV